MSYCIPIVVGLFILCLRSHATVVENERSPQYLYMEKLRNTTKNLTESEVAGENSAKAPGKLLATSFKDISKSSTVRLS